MEFSFKIKMIFCFFLGVVAFSCNQNIEFDSEEWKRNGGARSSLDIKYNMVEDLIYRRILIDKSVSEVQELIGIPSNLRKKDTTRYKYYLVQAKYGWADIDPEELIYLKVQYNDKGVSQSVSLYSTQ